MGALQGKEQGENEWEHCREEGWEHSRDKSGERLVTGTALRYKCGVRRSDVESPLYSAHHRNSPHSDEVRMPGAGRPLLPGAKKPHSTLEIQEGLRQGPQRVRAMRRSQYGHYSVL